MTSFYKLIGKNRLLWEKTILFVSSSVLSIWLKDVLWIYTFGYVWKIFILPFLNTLGYTLFKKYNVLPRHFRLELLPFRRGVIIFSKKILEFTDIRTLTDLIILKKNLFHRKKILFGINEVFRRTFVESMIYDLISLLLKYCSILRGFEISSRKLTFLRVS